MEQVLRVTQNNTGIDIFKNKQTFNVVDGDAIIKEYINTLNSPFTKRNYAKAIYSFLTYVYGEDKLTFEHLRNINPSHALSYRDYWHDKLLDGEIKTSTFNGKIKGLKQFYDWLIFHTTKNTNGQRLFTINPFNNIKQEAENDSEGSDALTPEEVLLMLNNPTGTTEHLQERNRLLIELAVTTGIRNTALITATINDIMKVGTDYIIKVVDKENKTDIKPINNYYDRLMKWYNKDLETRIENRNSIFNLHPSSANRLVREWAKMVGIDKRITFHSLRATCGILVYYNNNKNIYVAQKFLRHSHQETTQIYLEKENKIDHSGENILVQLEKVEDFNEYVKTLNREQLLDILLNKLDTNTKINLSRLL